MVVLTAYHTHVIAVPPPPPVTEPARPRPEKSGPRFDDRKLSEEEKERIRQICIDSISRDKTFDLNNPPRQPYVFQEYPKMLYRDGKSLTVKSRQDELEARAKGWRLNGLLACD